MKVIKKYWGNMQKSEYKDMMRYIMETHELIKKYKNGEENKRKEYFSILENMAKMRYSAKIRNG